MLGCCSTLGTRSDWREWGDSVRSASLWIYTALLLLAPELDSRVRLKIEDVFILFTSVNIVYNKFLSDI